MLAKPHLPETFNFPITTFSSIQSTTKGNNPFNWCLRVKHWNSFVGGLFVVSLALIFKRLVRSRHHAYIWSLFFSERLIKLLFIYDLYNWKTLKWNLEGCLRLRLQMHLLFTCLIYHRERKVTMIAIQSSQGKVCIKSTERKDIPKQRV